ncbi:TerC family protein [Alteribacter natronophilus]|uniref:TerC family protein n=1 Tax=Alteribacter natronophilus TaxID=2583810 RepID=UPI001FE9B125|nr:TerC family protein [Alteribacter natronophilus]
MNSDFFVALLTIIGIDLILGGDNAIVVAMACRKLPPHLRNKAIFIGILFAIAARGLLTVIAIHLLSIPYLMGIGGILLLYIAYRLLTAPEEETNIAGSTGIIAAIKTIVIADIVMGFDNVLAVAGAADGNIILVMTGLVISIPILIWGSRLILWAMKKVPSILYMGAGVLTFTAAGMIVHEPFVYFWLLDHGIPVYAFSGALTTAILLVGWLRNKVRNVIVIQAS